MTQRLFEAVGRERERLFVGRESELRVIEQWLDDPAAPTTVISVTGMRGVGKSTFLLRIHEIARTSPIPAQPTGALLTLISTRTNGPCGASTTSKSWSPSTGG